MTDKPLPSNAITKGHSKETAFTPGPWEVRRCGHSWDICLPAAPEGRGVVVVATGFGGRDDADIIAAAPDLYEAAAEALDTLVKLRDDLAEECADHHAQRIAVIALAVTQLEGALAKVASQ